MLRSICIAILIVLASISIISCVPVGYSVAGWDAEDPYWRNQYVYEPYYTGYGYDVYAPAYRYGVEAYRRYPGRRFEELNENEIRAGWEGGYGRGSKLDWAHARPAMRAAYMHAGSSHGNQHW